MHNGGIGWQQTEKEEVSSACHIFSVADEGIHASPWAVIQSLNWIYFTCSVGMIRILSQSKGILTAGGKKKQQERKTNQNQQEAVLNKQFLVIVIIDWS